MHRYEFSYPELKDDYENYISMTNTKFFSEIPKVLHFICIVSYVKQIPSYVLLSDEGLIHQLVHLIDEQTKDEPLVNNNRVKRSIRKDFKVLCKLA
ncbi:hypothetical protein BH09PAT1_BH09PAT1_6350 [soil metagenome]